MSTPKVNILLSTYNGEKYLEAQLKSIFSQTYSNFVLYIRDDGSSDMTNQVLYKFMASHADYKEKTVIISNPSQENLGYMGAFWHLLDHCSDADYYAFCDQDDIWFPEKIERGISFLEREKKESPLLYFSNYTYCDENLQPIHSAPSIKLPITFQDVLFYTPAFGFSIIINNKLRQIALQTTNRLHIPHDGWVQKIAAAFGKIVYDNECTAFYRRHHQAVTFSNSSLLLSIGNWIKNEIYGSAMKETHYILDQFMQEYGTYLTDNDHKILRIFTGNSPSFLNWIQRLFYPKKLRPSFGGELALRICFFLGRY